MPLRTKNYNMTFVEWGVKNGYQAFFQPTTIALPEGVSLNQYGWLPSPSTAEQVYPLVEIKPNEERTLYWYYERIVTNSDNPMRLSLEGNFTWDNELKRFDPNGWKTIAGYTINRDKDHNLHSLGLIKTSNGEAIRLRVHSVAGNNNDWYFKFVAIDLPYID